MSVFKKKREKFRKGNLEYSPSIKVRKMMEVIYFFKKKGRELTGSVPLERTAPTLNRNLDKEFSLQVSSPCQKEKDIFPHIP